MAAEIEIQLEDELAPSSAVEMDLGFKFRDDVASLITRSLKIMVPVLGRITTAEIILTVLTSSGATMAKSSDVPSELFVKYAERAAQRAEEKGD